MSAVNISKENFREEVLNAKNTVLLDFWAPWCGPCRSLLPIVEEIAKERSDILVAKVNVEDHPELARQYRVMSIPTLMVMKNGEISHRSVGEKSKSEILELL